MRICILTPYYPPEMGAPPARLHEIATRLVQFGHHVSVVTAFPSRPTGKIYPGYEGSFQKETIEEGVRVIRTWILPSSSSDSFVSRTINDLSFTWSSGWTISHRLGELDILIVQNPPLFSLFSAKAIAKRTGAKVVMWCGDIWPDVLLQSGQLKHGFMASCMKYLQQRCFGISSLLAVTNPTIAQDTQANYKCPTIAIWSNGVDTKLFDPTKKDVALRRSLGVNDEDILVGYIGLHGRFQGLDAIVEAAVRLKDTKNIKFIFMGDGVEKNRLIDRVTISGAANVQFFNPRPKAAMPSLVASCDVSVVSLLTRMPGTMPSKFYEACASGSVPLVADGCEAAPLVRKYSSGLVYEPGDTESVCQAIGVFREMTLESRKSMSNAARKLSLRFDRDVLAENINKCLHSLNNGTAIPDQTW